MKKLTTLLLALVAGAGTMFASNTSVDGIWYNFDDGNLTAEVTYRGDYSSAWEEYSGEVVIPSSVTYNDKTYIVTSIGDDAFYRCHGLTSVTIPNSVTSIGDVAFSYCSGLTSLSVEAGNTVYDSRNNCNAIIKTSTNTLIFGCQNTTIPNTVTSIGEYAFYNCIYLTSVTIPNSVTSIGNLAFRGCTGLTSLSVKAGNTVYDSRNNCNAIIKTSTNTLIWGCQNTTIPNSVTSIGDDAFAYCSGLTSVTIPNSVTSIGLNAFNRCSGLTAVTNYATTPQSINSNVFEYVNKSTCVLNVPKESVSLYQAAEVWKEFTNIMGVDVPEEPIETIEGDYTIYYVDKESQDLYNHVVTLYVPVAPAIEGFTFIGWQTVSSMLSEGITIQAVYQSNIPTNAPAVYTNPANPAQKLIKNGNVYILTDDKTYTITGQQVK